MTVRERIEALQGLMKRRGVDVYIVPSADFHQSEYVGDYFKAREFLTGFTGSAGTAVITKERSALWTDGRYFLQAEAQLADTGIYLQKAGMAGVPTLEAYLKDVLPRGGCIGFDGRTIGAMTGKNYEKIAKEKEGSIVCQEDLIGEIWKDRPALSREPAFTLDDSYAGEPVASKLKRLRDRMRQLGADVHILTSLDDIGWLLNIRGNDVAYCPLVLSYAMIRLESVELYADAEKFSVSIQKNFQEQHVELCPYDTICEQIRKLSEEYTVLVDPQRINYALYQEIPKNVRVIEAENPTILMKAVKNDTEVKHIRRAHLKDGVAVTKFMYWLKTQMGKKAITELDASSKLEAFRAEQEHFLGPSFAPISAYGEHAAIVHYSATEQSNIELEQRGFYLSDTGGHYLEGSTDITRTIALGELTEEEKRDFTMVAAGMLHLADAVFLEGCTGMNLDYAARAPFWKKGKDFHHGTGHGVGYLGNIHEPPVTFNWIQRSRKRYPLEKNMVITDEPGIYVEGSHGIRTENELLVCQGERNAYGQFLYFEPLTLAPIDLDAIVPEQLTEEECELLNAYHRKVYETISPYLSQKENDWLKIYTRSIGKS